MNEKFIQKRLYSFWNKKGHIITIPNYRFSYGYADLISITRKLYVHEFEIKCTVPDFKRDFEKLKHRFLGDKHRSSKYYNLEGKEKEFPNYFWYATPEGLVNDAIIPEYAGFLEIPDGAYFGINQSVKIIKKAPKLHKKSMCLDELKRLAIGFTARFWNNKNNG